MLGCAKTTSRFSSRRSSDRGQSSRQEAGEVDFASWLPHDARAVSDIDQLPDDILQILDTYGFDRIEFEQRQARVASGELSAESNIVDNSNACAICPCNMHFDTSSIT